MINSVRNTVLSVLNKNNYGYISPSDFNQYALQAQMELFEEYFSSYNKTVNMENQRLSGSDYADISRPLAEMLEIFMVDDFLFPVSNGAGTNINQFFSPSLTTTGNEAYMINKVVCYTNLLSSGTSDPVIINPFELIIPTPGNFIANGVSPGDIVLNTTTKQNALVVSVTSEESLIITEDIFSNPSEGYAVYAATDYSEAEKVSNGRISALNASILTAPSTMFPAYTMIGDRINTSPSSIVGYGALKATYFRYPKPPKWTYVTLVNGEPSFDQSQPDYQDFEMPQEDEYKLAMKILQYCGLSIREIQVTQFAIAQEQHEQPSFSQQQ
jgi:hypothetical protein